MFRTDQTTADLSPRNPGRGRFWLLREPLVWNSAWREFRHLQTLDARALADVGLSPRMRDTITVAQIAARIRG